MAGFVAKVFRGRYTCAQGCWSSLSTRGPLARLDICWTQTLSSYSDARPPEKHSSYPATCDAGSRAVSDSESAGMAAGSGAARAGGTLPCAALSAGGGFQLLSALSPRAAAGNRGQSLPRHELSPARGGASSFQTTVGRRWKQSSSKRRRVCVRRRLLVLGPLRSGGGNDDRDESACGQCGEWQWTSSGKWRGGKGGISSQPALLPADSRRRGSDSS